MTALMDGDSEFKSLLAALTARVFDQLQNLASIGAIDAFSELGQAVLRLALTREGAQARLKELFDARSQFDESIQFVLAELLGVAAGTPAVDKPLPDQGKTQETLRVSQLGTALLRSWSAAGDSERSKTAFLELSAVTMSFFGLQLGGVAGEVNEYNPRVHELVVATPREPPRQVKLLRPWVEYAQGPRSVIIIKGLAEPA